MWQLVSKRHEVETARQVKGLTCNWHSVTCQILLVKAPQGPPLDGQATLHMSLGGGRYCCCHLCKVCFATASDSFPLNGEKARFLG